MLGFGGGELVVDDAPEALPLPALVRLAAFGRRAERPEMGVAHAGTLDAGAELPFGKPGPARQRQVAHVDDSGYSGTAERRQDVGEAGFLIADQIKRFAGHL